MSTVTLHAQEAATSRLADAAAGGIAATLVAIANRGLSALAALRHAHSARQQERQWARETSRARALAARYAETDPGFAADLHAAVMRHDGAARLESPTSDGTRRPA